MVSPLTASIQGWRDSVIAGSSLDLARIGQHAGDGTLQWDDLSRHCAARNIGNHHIGARPVMPGFMRDSDFASARRNKTRYDLAHCDPLAAGDVGRGPGQCVRPMGYGAGSVAHVNKVTHRREAS